MGSEWTLECYYEICILKLPIGWHVVKSQLLMTLSVCTIAMKMVMTGCSRL